MKYSDFVPENPTIEDLYNAIQDVRSHLACEKLRIVDHRGHESVGGYALSKIQTIDVIEAVIIDSIMLEIIKTKAKNDPAQIARDQMRYC